MADVKVCNLDLIAPITKRELVLNGAKYAVEPLTVEKFIQFTRLQQKISENASIEEGLGVMKEIIRTAIPDMPVEIMDTMAVSHLQLVVAFIRDEIPDEVLNGEAPKKNNKKAKVKEEGANAEDKSGN